MSDFGSTFKNARESMGLTLEQIAAETHIGTRFLQAIETEQFHLLPGGIFSRGFVRSYAEHLKLDPEKAVADFERQSIYREPVLMEGLRVSVPQSDRTSRSLYPIAIACLITLIFVFYGVTREATKSVNASQPPVQPAPASAPAAAPAAPPAQPGPETVVPNPEDGVAQNPAPAVAIQSEPVKDALTIVLSARQASWIRVRADGTSANSGEVLRPGTTRRYTAQGSIGLTLGNAGGVDIQVNDRQLRPLGKNGQVRSLTITPENLKDLL